MSKSEKPKAGQTVPVKPMSSAQRAYEEKRAGKAGLSLDKHLAAKERRAAEEARKAAPPPAAKKKGVISRLLDRARRPI